METGLGIRKNTLPRILLQDRSTQKHLFTLNTNQYANQHQYGAIQTICSKKEN